MQSKVFCMYNEGAKENTHFIGAKGFSLLIDVDGEKTLLDTGMRGRYLMHNMDHAHVKPDEIDRVVLTHAHRSNINGLKKLLENRTKLLKVYANSSYPGISSLFVSAKAAVDNMDLITVRERTDLSEHLSIIGPFGPMDELVLALRTKRGPAVMTSCFHCGTECVLDSAKEEFGNEAVALIGGLHLPRAKQETVDPTADVLKRHGPPKMYINHCGTPSALMHLRVRFGLSGVNDLYVGEEITFEV
ncbi:MAG: MBL fold metallo-hydrolase [Candidatus Methanomethylophilaceae archaeon]|nr:MBL fold metallo-hydrolase [Candidatus Methanomethylophilaceae archaeon]